MLRHRYRALPRMNFSSPYVDMPRRLTVEENLRVYATLYSVPNTAQRLKRVAEDLDITQFMRRRLGSLSAGQRTRVALGQGPDQRARAVVARRAHRLARSRHRGLGARATSTLTGESSGATILLASHNMAEVERLCSDVIVLRAGKVIDRGSPKGLLERYGRGTLEDVFLDIARGHGRRDGGGAMNGPHAAFSPRRVWAMALRYIYLLRGSWPRYLELAYWPTVQMILWGFITQFFATNSSYIVAASASSCRRCCCGT